ncbi:MAG: protein kinase [Lysobacterales bacterium]
MTSEHWQSVKSLFQELLELAADAREDALREAALSQPEIAAEVLAMLQAHEHRDSALDRPCAPALEVIESRMPARIGPYRPTALLGRGGMGVVWLCERTDGGFEQQVAVKQLSACSLRGDLDRRFARERQILARLAHPHIARLLDGGIAGDGSPWFAMEYVDGEPLTHWCDRLQLGIHERLTLFLQLVDAVDFAHRNLVIHRDLKPANVLVAHGELKLLDFGIARLLDAEDAEGANTAARLMTPDYAAPEQWLGTAISTATDVYALGLMLFELLCGRRPFMDASGAGSTRLESLAAGPPSMRRALVERGATEEAEVAARVRGMSASRLRQALSGDLQKIVSRALAVDPAARYPSALAMASDLRAWMAHQPLPFAGSSQLQSLGKFLRRHRLLVAVLGLLMLSLAGGAALTAWQAARAERAAQTAEAVRRTLTGLFSGADPAQSGGADFTVRELLDLGLPRIRRELAEQPELRRALLSDIGVVYDSLGQFDTAIEVYDEALTALPERLDREQASLLLRRASSRLSLSRLGEAEDDLARAGKMLGNAPSSDSLARQHVLLQIDALRVADRLTEALTAVEALVRELRASEPPAPQPLAAALRAQAEVLLALRRPQPALESLQEAAVLAPRAAVDPVEQAALDSQLARAYAAAGQISDALSLLRDALARQQRVLGAEHPTTLATLGELALRLQSTDAQAEARQLLQQQIDGRRRHFGDDHPALAVALNNLAVLDYREARYAEAAAGFARAREIWSASLGAGHDHVLSADANLAGSYIELGRSGEAVALLDHAISERRRRLDELGLYSLLLTRGLALEKMGERERALADLAEARDIGARSWTDAPGEWIWARTLLGRALANDGRWGEAEAELLAAVDWHAGDGMEDGPRSAAAMLALARTQRQLHGPSAESSRMGAQALEIMTRRLPADHPDLLKARAEAASLLH